MEGMKAASAAMVVAMLLAAIGCTPATLDPNGDPGTAGAAGQPSTTGVDLVTALQANTGPGRQLILGTNGGVVDRSDTGRLGVFADLDPEALMEAAAVVDLPVCSVEPQSLVFPPAASGPDGLSTADAATFCAFDDLTEMTQRLNGLQTPQLVVVIAGNTAITVHSTNGGINFFYDDDIGRLLRTARRLYVPACIVAPDALALPTAYSGTTAGLSVDQALARCGRS
jgi:hypothetical protein